MYSKFILQNCILLGQMLKFKKQPTADTCVYVHTVLTGELHTNTTYNITVCNAQLL